MKLSELLTDTTTGHLSHTKLWANIAYAAATVAFIKSAWANQASPDVWLIYLGVIGGHTVASKLISAKFGGANAQ